MINIMFSPRVVFRALRRYTSLHSNRRAALKRVDVRVSQRLLRKALFKFVLNAQTRHHHQLVSRARAQSDASEEALMGDLTTSNRRFEHLRTMQIVDSIASTILSAAFNSVTHSLMQLTYNRWFDLVWKRKCAKVDGARRLLFVFSTRVHVTFLMRAFNRLRNSGVLATQHVHRAFGERATWGSVCLLGLG
jgi:hypothetical protein